MVDHDQRFKVLLKEFLAAFFRAFFPAWADRFDFPRVDWLEQEVFTDPPRGERRSLDLVARLPLRPGVPPPAPGEPADPWLTLIHVEIESQDTVAPLRPRMLTYYEQLRRWHGLPVLPIALSAGGAEGDRLGRLRGDVLGASAALLLVCLRGAAGAQGRAIRGR
jgi:hypothetical protein